MQIKSTFRCHSSPLEGQKTNHETISNIGKYVKQLDISWTAGGIVKWCNHFGDFLWPSRSIHRYLLKRSEMFVSALFMFSTNLETTQMSTSDRQLNDYGLKEYYLAINRIEYALIDTHNTGWISKPLFWVIEARSSHPILYYSIYMKFKNRKN